MGFVSFAFPALLFLVLVGRVACRQSSSPGYQLLLLIASLAFYAWHVPVYVGILLTSTLLDYAVGRALDADTGRSRKLLLGLSITTNLGLLGFFKYYGFFAANLISLADEVGLPMSPPLLEVALPIGISFYTFQSMSYSIDVYRRHLRAERSFCRFLLYVAFFPQLVAGPIVRAREFFYQLDRPRRIRAPFVFQGVYLIVQGLFLKMVVADNLGHLVDTHWGGAAEPGGSRWLAIAVTIMFGGQIFCDFAGYTNLARGVAYLLGFRLPINFNAPYCARTFSDFWGRWHISLSQWLRDYLYVPLGGNRMGARRCMLNLLAVMVLGGLWHGAAWPFAVWGLIHGLALMAERLLGLNDARKVRSAFVRWLWPVVVQLVVLVAWGVFRAPTLDSGGTLIGNMIGGSNAFAGIGSILPLAVPCLLVVGLVHILPEWRGESGRPRLGPAWQALGTGVMLLLILMFYRVNREFIYFQF
jgi:alginate O-acetyltransferase complex protein AlgI